MRRTLPTLILTLLVSSCVGTEIGNPPTPTEARVSVDMLGVDTAPKTAIPIGLTVSEGLEVDRAVLLVGDLRFRHADTCGEAGADHTEGFVSELLEAGVELDDVRLPAGTYCRLDIGPRRGGEDGFASESPELDGLTAYAEGTYMGTPFVMRRESDDELSFRGEIELPAGEQTLFVAVDIPVWFDGLDMSAVPPEEDGTLVIGQGGAFEEEFEENFERSISVSLDTDGNSVLTTEDEHEEEEQEER